MKKIKYILLLTICSAIGCLYFAFADSSEQIAMAQTKPEAPKFALLVGINQYKIFSDKSKSIRHLSGTNNDVALMKSLLFDTYKFNSPNSSIKTLLNSEATSDGIMNAFKAQLIEKAKAYKETAKVEPKDGATVVFYYSGHGGKLDDVSGDETDKIDETIVPHDSDTDGSKDIIDDKFDEFLTQLKEYTTNITFVLDSCHSGTATRGGVSKSVQRNLKSNSRGDGVSLRDGMTRGESYVTISGSLPREESQEDVFTDPDTKKQNWNGALTFSLVHLLRRNPNMTYREMMREVQAKVVSMNKNQTPQVEGDIDRQIFGSSATRQRTPIFIKEVKLVKKNIDKEKPDEMVEVNEIKMDVGAIVGAGNGAAIAVFGKKPNSQLIEQIGSGVIIDPTDDFTSTGEVVLLDAAMKEVPKEATVQIISPSFSNGDKQTVALDFTDTSAKVFGDIETKLKDNAMLKTVKSKDLLNGLMQTRGKSSDEVSKTVGDWDVAVVRATFKEFTDGNTQPTVKSDGKGTVPKCAQKRFHGITPTEKEEGFFISNRLGQPLYNLWYSANDAEAAECLAVALDKFARLETLRKLSSGGSALNDGLNVELIRLQTKIENFKVIDRRKPLCEILPVAETQKTNLKLEPGDVYYLKITNNTDQELFIYIYSLTTMGQISLLFPQIEGAAAGEKLPRGATMTTNTKVSGQGNCAVFYIDPPELSPPGMETLKVIASTQDFPGKMLEQPAIAKGVRGPSLSQLIRQTATGMRSNAMRVNVSDLAIKNVDFEIVPKSSTP